MIWRHQHVGPELVLLTLAKVLLAVWFVLEDFVRVVSGLILTILLVFSLWGEQGFAMLATTAPATASTTSAMAAPIAAPIAASAVGPTKSFTEWKNEKVSRAKKQLQNSREHLALLSQKKNAPSAEIKQTIDQVAQDEWSVEIAEDLSSTDYLVLYLSTQSSPEKFKEAASKLSSEETAKVLEAYLNTVANHPMPKAKTKLPRHSDQNP